MRSLLLLLIALVACVAVATTARTPIGGVELTERFTPSPVLDHASTPDRVAPESRGRPVIAASGPAPTEAPVVPTDAPPPIDMPTSAPVPQACPATYFCYPRLGVAGAIVPYSDNSGASDVGLGIRQLTYIRDGIWLAGHAYTQFGRITGFAVGDIVFVRGQAFEITGSSVQRSCSPTTQAVAPLSLQTSLDPTTCGRVLVVQGRPAR